MFLKNNKGQSALEYLMTYGWALVVIVIVIAALVFLIQPSQVGGNTCSATSGILITNHQVTSSGITLVLSNQTAASLTNVDVNLSGTAGGSSTTGTTTIATLGTTSATQTVTLAPAPTAGSTYSLQVQFDYNDRDGLSRTVTSTCNGTSS